MEDSSAKIYLSLIHYPVLSLGPGKRLGIWFQGCTGGCSGCIAEYSWNQLPEYMRTIQDITEEMQRFFNAGARRITVSGGEPFEQPEALEQILLYARKNGADDILVYSRFHYEMLKKNFGNILCLTDVLIDGAFEQGNESTFIWKGSENQRMIILSENDIIKKQYEEFKTCCPDKPPMQVVNYRGRMYVIGIPRQKDAEVIKNGLI